VTLHRSVLAKRMNTDFVVTKIFACKLHASMDANLLLLVNQCVTALLVKSLMEMTVLVRFKFLIVLKQVGEKYAVK